MNKTFGKVLCAFVLIAVLLLGTACSFFSSDDEGRQIANITYQTGEREGVQGTWIIIEYEGDEYPNSEFFLPNGEQGEEGVGIESVDWKLSDDGLYTIITINYTDPIKWPTTDIRIPNGMFPTGMTTEVDEETGDITLTITISDGTMQTFTLHNGVDGKDGDVIIGMETVVETDDETGETSTWLVITLERLDEEGNNVTYRLRMPDGAQGEQGNGIESIIMDERRTQSDPDNIWLLVLYSNGSSDYVSIPKTNRWYHGNGAPGKGQYNMYDYYVDEQNKVIYYKNSVGEWVVLFDFGELSAEEHTVQFYLDQTTRTDSQTIVHGNSFYSAGKTLPLPDRTAEGLRFVGWYTEYIDPDSGEAINPNLGQFTNLTPVLSNMILYARWERI